MVRLRVLGAIVVTAFSFVASTGCGDSSIEPNKYAAGLLTIDPSAWPNLFATPDGALITTGLMVEGRELVVAFSRLRSPPKAFVQEAAWLDRATGAMTLVPPPEWGWRRPDTPADGLQLFTQVVTSAGLLEYGYMAGTAKRAMIECAGTKVDAGIGAWSLEPTVIAFWSLREGAPTRHDSPQGERPVVTVLDGAGSQVDRQVLTEPPQRTDG
jgi:hypothetical protein